MKAAKKSRLEQAGWRVGNTADFLDLPSADENCIEVRLALSTLLKSMRTRSALSQTRLAELIESSQSRVAKMEASDPPVSIDLLIRCLLAPGTTRTQIGKSIASS